MSLTKRYFHDEIEQRAAREECVNDNEWFEILSCNGVDEITWNEALNSEYTIWQYLNLK